LKSRSCVEWEVEWELEWEWVGSDIFGPLKFQAPPNLIIMVVMVELLLQSYSNAWAVLRRRVSSGGRNNCGPPWMLGVVRPGRSWWGGVGWVVFWAVTHPISLAALPPPQPPH